MKFGILLNRMRNSSFVIKAYFVLGIFLIPVFFILYTNILLQKTKKEAEIIPSLVAKHFAFSSKENYESLIAQYVLDEIIAKVEYPIIITDENRIPLFWKNVNVDVSKRFNDLNQEETKMLFKMIRKMESKNRPIPLLVEDSNKIIGYTFFDESKVLYQLRLIPYLEMGLIIIFILIGIYGLNLIKKNENNQLWVGLAKETAHQFGTPITAILGWIEFLRLHMNEKYPDSDVNILLDQMKTDVGKLQTAASRFGKVGSSIKLKEIEIGEIISEIVDYFSSRLPSGKNKIRIYFVNKLEDIKVMIDPDLIKWAIENLVKNAIDAMTMKGGNIMITAYCSRENIYILIKDQGMGMTKAQQKKIFKPGFTTKKRGWGLGLSLSKRIIEEYHHGKIRISESILEEGTTFEVIIPQNTKRG